MSNSNYDKKYFDWQKHDGMFGAVANKPKFNLVGPVEWNNLELAQKIATVQKKELKFEMVDFHSSRPGHDLRYALDGNLMKQLGWKPKISIEKRIHEVVNWTLKNKRWLKL